jgi:formate-dependent phosphoribosylglycinamide formyltransferase (GAR transformylase)
MATSIEAHGWALTPAVHGVGRIYYALLGQQLTPLAVVQVRFEEDRVLASDVTPRTLALVPAVTSCTLKLGELHVLGLLGLIIDDRIALLVHSRHVLDDTCRLTVRETHACLHALATHLLIRVLAKQLVSPLF